MLHENGVIFHNTRMRIHGFGLKIFCQPFRGACVHGEKILPPAEFGLLA
jgi:hypothetical protein